MKIGTDVAASEFYSAEKKHYDLDFKNPSSPAEMKKTAVQLAEYYKGWLEKYPFVSIEDPFDQDDWDAYKHFMKEVGQKVQIVGDDLLVTNPTRVKKALEVGACNALLLKALRRSFSRHLKRDILSLSLFQVGNSKSLLLFV